MKMLVIENELVRIDLFIEMLGKYRLSIADNFEDAVSFLNTDLFDFIFLDEMIGPDMASYFGSNYDHPNLSANIIIHSLNKNATAAMRSKLVPLCDNVISIPFGKEFFSYLGLTFNE